MPVEVLFPSWRNASQFINYPFSDNVTLANLDGVAIPKTLFDDARIYLIGSSQAVYMNSVTVDTVGNITFSVADLNSNATATGVYAVDSGVPNISLNDSYGRPAGILVSTVSELDLAAGMFPVGTTIFQPTQTTFSPVVIIPVPNVGLRGILLDDGSVMTGDVYLVGTNGVVLSNVGGYIRADVLGDPYATIKAFEAEGTSVSTNFNGLKTINQISPDANGDFKITVGGNLSEYTILRISQDTLGNITLTAVGMG